MAVRAKKIQPAKAQAIEEAKKTFADYSDFIFADYRGLTVEQITALRDKLREKNAVLKVVKNNFARIAKEDSNEVAKVLFDFAKDAPALAVKGASIANEIYDQAKIEAYSKVPGKKQLYAMLMSAMNGPAQKLAATLKAYADKKAAEGAN